MSNMSKITNCKNKLVYDFDRIFCFNHLSFGINILFTVLDAKSVSREVVEKKYWYSQLFHFLSGRTLFQGPPRVKQCYR